MGDWRIDRKLLWWVERWSKRSKTYALGWTGLVGTGHAGYALGQLSFADRSLRIHGRVRVRFSASGCIRYRSRLSSGIGSNSRLWTYLLGYQHWSQSRAIDWWSAGGDQLLFSLHVRCRIVALLFRSDLFPAARAGATPGEHWSATLAICRILRSANASVISSLIVPDVAILSGVFHFASGDAAPWDERWRLQPRHHDQRINRSHPQYSIEPSLTAMVGGASSCTCRGLCRHWILLDAICAYRSPIRWYSIYLDARRDRRCVHRAGIDQPSLTTRSTRCLSRSLLHELLACNSPWTGPGGMDIAIRRWPCALVQLRHHRLPRRDRILALLRSNTDRGGGTKRGVGIQELEAAS